MNYNNGFQFLAGALGFLSCAAFIAAVQERLKELPEVE